MERKFKVIKAKQKSPVARKVHFDPDDTERNVTRSSSRKKKNLLMPPKKKKFNISATKVKRSKRISLINDVNSLQSPQSTSMVVSHNISDASSQISSNS